MKGWKDGRKEIRTDERSDGRWTPGGTVGRIKERIDERPDGRIDEPSVERSRMQFNVNNLQKVPNTPHRVVLRATVLTPTPLPAKLHWSPIERRVLFKLATLTFKSLVCGQPSRLSVVLERFIPVLALPFTMVKYVRR